MSTEKSALSDPMIKLTLDLLRANAGQIDRSVLLQSIAECHDAAVKYSKANPREADKIKKLVEVTSPDWAPTILPKMPEKQDTPSSRTFRKPRPLNLSSRYIEAIREYIETLPVKPDEVARRLKTSSTSSH